MLQSTKQKPCKEILDILAVSKKLRISQKMLSREAGIYESHLSDLKLGTKSNPRIDTIIRLWEALGRLIPVERLAEFPKALATESAQKRLGNGKSKPARKFAPRSRARRATGGR